MGNGGDAGEPARTAKDAAKIEIRKQYAKEHNVYGVRLCNKGVEDNQAELAGYLHLRDTGELRELLMESSVAKGFLKVWMETRRSGFSIARKDQNAVWSKTVLWTYIKNPISLKV